MSTDLLNFCSNIFAYFLTFYINHVIINICNFINRLLSCNLNQLLVDPIGGIFMKTATFSILFLLGVALSLLSCTVKDNNVEKLLHRMGNAFMLMAILIAVAS